MVSWGSRAWSLADLDARIAEAGGAEVAERYVDSIVTTVEGFVAGPLRTHPIKDFANDMHTGGMAMPETDLTRIGRWCRERMPDLMRDEVRVEAEIADRHVTIIETRAP